MVVFVEETFLIHVIATPVTVIGDLLAGSQGFCQCTAAFIHMPCAADLALIGFFLDTVLGISNMLVLMAALVSHFTAGGTEFVMFICGYLPLVVQCMALRSCFLFLDHIADHTLDTMLTRIYTSCCVTPLNFFPVMLFYHAAFGTAVIQVTVFAGINPAMLRRIANFLLAVVTILNMGSVTKVCKDNIGMGTIFHNTAAVADIGLGAIFIGDGFHSVVDPDAAIHRRYAVANGAAVAGRATAHIPAIGQSVANDQYIAVLQVHAGHRLAGVVCRTTHAVHPAGTAGVVKLTEAATGAGTLIQPVAVQAAPQGCQTRSRTEPCIDGRKNFRFRSTGPGAALQSICAVSGSQTLQVETAVQSACVTATPSKGICCRTEGFTGVFTHNRFGYHIGYRFVCQDFVAKICYHTQTKRRHIYINGSIADLLARFSALAVQGQRQLAVITQSVFRIDGKLVGIGVTHFRVFRIQVIFRSSTR